MDIRRSLLLGVLAFSIVMLWDNWQRYNGKPATFFPAPTQRVAASPNAPGSDKNGNNKDLPSAIANTAQTNTANVPGGVASVANMPTSSERVSISTDLFKAQLDSQGGELRHLELLAHKDNQDKTKPVVLFDDSSARTYLAQTGLIGAPDLPNHKSPMRVLSTERELGQGKNQLEVQFETESGGVKLRKTYIFTRGSYVIELRHDLTNTGTQAVVPTLYQQLVRDGGKLAEESSFYSTFTGPAVYTTEKKFQKIEFAEIDKNKTDFVKQSSSGWVAMVQHYFTSALIPQNNAPREFYSEKVGNVYRVGIKQAQTSLAPTQTLSSSTQLFAGPQEEKILEQVTPGLELVKDYGVFALFAKPLFWLLDKIHSFVGNWGWAIVLLTVLIKAVFFPLSAAGYKSMAKMKKVSPRLQALRERHKSDPQAMNKAMMEMYKTEKINPLGGCFPMLVQIPVFIALYWVLLASVEMRGAPWWGWIHDLSSPDPWYLLPVIMAVSMFLQTKMNPTPPDPIQAKVMLYMPLAFSVMFFFFPAGLVLYWVVNNILSILQQWQITRMIDGPKTKAA